jgi:nucleoside-diphosphate-sugar epimerase
MTQDLDALPQGLSRAGSEMDPGDYHVVLVEWADGQKEMLSTLRRLRRRWPLSPVGLIVPQSDRAEAFALLRDRLADRVILEQDVDASFDVHLESLRAQSRMLTHLHTAWAPRKAQTWFITGATGFLGGHFLNYLLRCTDHRVIALTRAGRGAAHDRRLDYLMSLYPGRIEPVDGDVTVPGLGLSLADRARIAERVDAVWHLAAITRFDEVLRESLFEVNLAGTQHVVELARTLPGLECFYHVSTAYTAGRQPRGCAVPEAPLAPPSAFKNPYEASKYAAEQYVSRSGLPHVVFRPSIILGERVSGLCDGQTVYNVAKMLRLARMYGERAAERGTAGEGPTTFRVEVDPGTVKNLVPVDDVVRRMLLIAASDPAPGSHFNLAHDRPTPMAELIQVIASLLDIREYAPVATLEGAALSPAESMFQRIAAVFKPYMLESDPPFISRAAARASGEGALAPVDTTQLRYLLQSFLEQHLECPPQRVSVPA